MFKAKHRLYPGIVSAVERENRLQRERESPSYRKQLCGELLIAQLREDLQTLM